MENKELEATEKSLDVEENPNTEPLTILEEIYIEELAIDGICGVY